MVKPDKDGPSGSLDRCAPCRLIDAIRASRLARLDATILARCSGVFTRPLRVADTLALTSCFIEPLAIARIRSLDLVFSDMRRPIWANRRCSICSALWGPRGWPHLAALILAFV